TIFQLVVELAEVAKLPSMRGLLGGLEQVGLGDIAQGDDVLAQHRLQVRRSTAAAANDGQVELGARFPGRQEGGRSGKRRPGQGGALKEPAAVEQATAVLALRHGQLRGSEGSGGILPQAILPRRTLADNRVLDQDESVRNAIDYSCFPPS